MAIPFIIGGIALAAGAYGAKKGIDAMNKNKEAERIVKRAQERFEKAKEKLEEEGRLLNEKLEDFAKFKLKVFTTQINKLLELIKKCKDRAHSSLNNENIQFTPEEIRQLEYSVSSSMEIISGMGKGLASGALTALGVYGSVGMLASASTGTAIATLSGAAATNATLAWLGGGSLAAGGFGMAGGMAVLGGLVAGPLIAVTGLVMDSKAEENLTNAYEYEKEVDIQIEKIELAIEELLIVSSRVDELKDVIEELIIRFDSTFDKIEKVSFICKIKRWLGISNICEAQEIDQLIILGKSLKRALDISLLDQDGNANKNFRKEIEKVRL